MQNRLGAAASQTHGDICGWLRPPHPQKSRLSASMRHIRANGEATFLLSGKGNQIRYFDFLLHRRQVSLLCIRRIRPGFRKKNRSGGWAVGLSDGQTIGQSGGREARQSGVGRSGGRRVIGRSGGRAVGQSDGRVEKRTELQQAPMVVFCFTWNHMQ